jgi:fructan beta-fructosidase
MFLKRIGLMTMMAFVMALGAMADEDILIADFESKTYGDWTVTGESFGEGPARGTLPGQMEVSGYEGRRLVNSFTGGDGTTGILSSPPFTIERKYLCFLIGGGGHAGETCINLLQDGEVVRTETGPNLAPGGTEQLSWQAWEVSDLHGEEVSIQIVDARTDGWGHINVDHIVQSDEKLSSTRSRELIAEKQLLNLPVQNGAPKCWIRVLDGERILREFDIELAKTEAEIDFWVTLDLSEWQGKPLTIFADQIRKGTGGFDLITQADGIIAGEDLYQEKYRPQFHFSPKRGWNNDPNGMVYYDGEYHLFFQHNPFGWNWGNMTWGHAVSTDLVHWTELGDAIHPDEHGTIFSGSAVVDWNNTTGFQTGDEPPLICIYTYAGGLNPWSKEAKFTQAIAYSNDRGRTWTKYEGNPVQEHIKGGNRDPKVLWHTPCNQWVIVLFLDEKEMAFFTSKDLKSWTHESTLDSFFECPELFQLPIDSDKANERWILYGASGEYFVGQFDGKEFKPDGESLPFNYGDCFYASQTFSDIPAEDGRRIQIAWGRTGHREMPFNQMMDFPVELTLRSTDEGPRLFAWPVREIELLYQGKKEVQDIVLREEAQMIEGVDADLLDMTMSIEVGNARQVELSVHGLQITYDVAKEELRCKEKVAPLKQVDGRIALRFLVDRLSVEIFGNEGRVYMPMSHVNEKMIHTVEALARGGTSTVRQLTAHALASSWKHGGQGGYVQANN